MKGKRFDVKQFLGKNSVPVLFIIICAVLIPVSGLPVSYILNEAMTRLGRNAFLILSLLIPIMAGMGLNFAMTLGAMAGEIALILVADWQIWGIPGLVLAAILSIPLSILLGLMCGSILNRAKGREMVTSYFIAYCMTGVYQLVVLYMMGPIIPILHNTLKLPRGFGIRNTVSLLQMRQSVDNALAVYVGGVKATRDESMPGYYYSVARGDARGLSILIDDLTPGEHPPAGEEPMYVRIKQGLVQTVNSFCKDELTFTNVNINANSTPDEIADAIALKSKNGALMSLRDNYKTVMENIDKKISQEQRRIETWESRQKTIFANLETLLKKYGEQQKSLESQLKQLSGND